MRLTLLVVQYFQCSLRGGQRVWVCWTVTRTFTQEGICADVIGISKRQCLLFISMAYLE